jgi:hypothetical protein
VDAADLLRLVFWIWLGASVVILVRRYLTRKNASEETAAPEEPGSLSPGMSAALRPDPAPAPPTEAGSPPLIPAAPAASTPGPSHSIFDSEPAPAAVTKPMAELVKGITLPCDLAPLVDHISRPGVIESVAFVTEGIDSAEVGRALGEELRRLGYELQALDQTEALATRDGDRLKIAVHPDPMTVERQGATAFPTATEGDTVAELWTD